MVATFAWSETYGTGTGTTGTPTNINFGSTSAIDLTPSTYPITAGTNSFEKWVRGGWSGSFTRIDNVQFWKSAGAYVTGESIKWLGAANTTYTAATNATSSIATVALPTADPGTANVTIAGVLTGSLTATGFSDYVVQQMQISGTASAGPVNQKTLTLQYDEV
jgi:hypothetical protein